MQKIIYICDNAKCKKEIGDRPHISLAAERRHDVCGIALPPGVGENKNSGSWYVKPLPKWFVHFCNGKCAGQWFDSLIAAASKTK